jgi:peroxiredoxin
MPALDRLFKQYRQKGLQVVAVNVGQSKARVGKFLDSVPVTYPVLLDPEKGSLEWYSVVGLPRTYVLDRKGAVRYKLIGEASEETLRKCLAEVF